VLEGGYNLPALAASAVAHVKALMAATSGLAKPDPEDANGRAP